MKTLVISPFPIGTTSGNFTNNYLENNIKGKPGITNRTGIAEVKGIEFRPPRLTAAE